MDAQAILENTRSFTMSVLVEHATNTVMGGTDESLAMEKAGANQAVAETMLGINAKTLIIKI